MIIGAMMCPVQAIDALSWTRPLLVLRVTSIYARQLMALTSAVSG